MEFSVSAFGDELRRLIEAKGVTQVQLGEASGVGQSFISALVRGEKSRLGADVLFKIADALGVTADHFRPFFVAPPEDKTGKKKSHD